MQDIDRMANFHAIAEPMSIVKSLYATRDWHIVGENKEIEDWLTKCLKKFWDKFINDSMTAMEYGYFCGVKSFYLGSDGKWWVNSIKPLKPHYLTILEGNEGDYAGVKQDFSEGLANEPIVKTYEAKDTFIYTYNMKFDDYYGNSRLLAARYPYTVYKYIIELLNIFMEQYISPSKVGRAPHSKGKTKDGVEKWNVDILSDKLKEMETGGAKDIVLPSETDEKGEPRWDLKLLESSRTGGDYVEYLKFLEQKMSHGVLVPELAFAQTGSGSYNLFDGQESFLAYKSDLDMAQFAAAVQEQIIDQLLDLNFGAEHIGKYTLEFTKASRKDRELGKTVIQALSQNNAIEFDYEQLSRMTGLKITKNIIETAKQIEDVKAGKKTKAQEVVEKKETKGQMELPLDCGCKQLEKEKRPLTPAELKVNFAKINDIYDEEEEISQTMANLLRKIQSLVLSKTEKPYIAGDVSKIKNFTLDNKTIYENEYISQLMGVYEEAFDTVKTELGLSKALSTGAMDITSLKLQQAAQKQVSDVEFAVKGIILGGITNGLAFGDLEIQLNDFFNDYISNKMPFGVSASIQEIVDDGRREAADDPLVELAQWSAILDDSVCDLCASLDMMVVDVDSADYNKYTPGNIHPNCRCVWIYILKDEEDKPPVDFKAPPADLQDKYMRR
jgi:hypothetical protein